ncbi:MAG: GGDEF domain-containing protein [Lachnospiraceae bacterium]
MNRIFTAGILFAVALSSLLIFLVGLRVGNHENTAIFNWDGFQEVTEYTMSYPSENEVQIVFEIPDQPTDLIIMAVRTQNQILTVYTENHILCELRPGNNLFGHTTGTRWNYITILPTDLGRPITILLQDIYPHLGVSKMTDEILVGEVQQITAYLFSRDHASMIINFLTIMTGLGLLFYWFLLWKAEPKKNNELLLLSVFSIMIGVWSLCKLDFTRIMISNNLIVDYTAGQLMYLTFIAWISYIRMMFANRASKIWDVFIGIILSLLIFSTLLQIANEVDYHESLFYIHIVMILFTLYIMCEFFREIKNRLLDQKHILYLSLTGFMVLGFIIDIILLYWTLEDRNRFGRITYFVYIIIMGFLISSDAVSYVRLANKADSFQNLAFTDSMTDLLNRTAFNRDLRKYENQDLTAVTVFMMDLNHLKYCNDNIGHTEGDTYIKRAGEIIRSSFYFDHKIYRIGGDEFCVFCEHLTEKEKQCILSKIRKAKIIVESEDYCFLGHIAIGYATGRVEDSSIYEVIHQADMMMYTDKRQPLL